LPIQIHGNGIGSEGGKTGQEAVVRADRRIGSKMAPFALAILLLPFAGGARRARKRLSRAISIVLLIAAGITATMGLSGCGGNGSGFFAQAPQAYTLTVTATSGSLSRSTNLTLTVE
jgi:hypothetical protein